MFRTTPLLGVLLLMSGCARSVDPVPSIERAAVLMSEGRLDEAIGQCDAVLAEEPLNFHALLFRGQLHQRAGHREAAMDDFVVAVSLRPEDTNARSLHASLVSPRAPPSMPTGPIAEAIVRNIVEPSFADSSRDSESYGSTPKRDTRRGRQQNRNPRRQAAPSIYDQLRQAIEHSNQQLLENEAIARDRLFDRNSGWEEVPMDELPRHVVRFDLTSMGIDPGYINAPTTTGRRYARVPLSEEFAERTRALVGQPLPARRCRPRSGAAAFFQVPTGPWEDVSIPPPERSCADGLDNNGDGWTDSQDPMCWADRTNPRSYSPELYESGRLFETTAGTLPPPIPTPVPPAP